LLSVSVPKREELHPFVAMEWQQIEEHFPLERSRFFDVTRSLSFRYDPMDESSRDDVMFALRVSPEARRTAPIRCHGTERSKP
jgi:hypothetical protein